MGNREQLINACEIMRLTITDCTEINAEIDLLNEELQVVAELVSKCVKENASTQQSQEDYCKKYDSLVNRYENVAEKLKEATAKKENRMLRDTEFRSFIASLKNTPLVLKNWDEEIWICLLDIATIHANGDLIFRFKDGTEIREQWQATT